MTSVSWSERCGGGGCSTSSRICICSAVVGIIAIKSQAPELGGGIATEWHGGSPLATFYSMLTVMVHYLQLLFWPTELSAYYEYPLKSSIDIYVVGSALLLLVLAGGAFALWRRNRKMFFWAALVLLGILPVAQIIPLVTIMNDRYLYFPMLGAAALITGLVAGWSSIPMPRSVIIPVTAIVLSALMIISVNRAKVWQNSYTLWADAHEKFPQSPLPCFGLGSIHLQRGELEKARDYFLQASRLGKKTALLLGNLGRTYLSLGDIEQAKVYVNVLANEFPDYAPGLILRGDYLRQTGDAAGAAEAYGRATAVMRGVKP